jgi:hypothetical protein
MAELPKHYEVVKKSGVEFIYEWWPVLFDGPVCRDEYEALMECHRHRNAVRAELLRELAAELANPKEHIHCVANAKDTGAQFRDYLAKSLGERAEFMESDQLEKGTPP